MGDSNDWKMSRCAEKHAVDTHILYGHIKAKRMKFALVNKSAYVCWLAFSHNANTRSYY